MSLSILHWARSAVMYCIMVLLGVLVTQHVSASPASYLRHVYFPHPFCESIADLDVSDESFYEIGNALPGQDTYNELIKLYRTGNESDFLELVEKFHRHYEGSPLGEAVDYLSVQFMIRRHEGKEDLQKLKEVEREFQRVQLLYPRSTLTPVLYSSLASLYLRKQQFGRALKLYEMARQEYPVHQNQCVFLMGVGETNFLLGQFKEAESKFKLLLQKCKNPRLRVGSRLRLADIEWKQRKLSAKKRYNKIIKDSLENTIKFYPGTFYQVGEINYQQGNYALARHYFEKFLSYRDKKKSCATFALKRLGDVALQLNSKVEDIKGKYLFARKHDPESDIGRFSFIHALLLDFSEADIAEKKRRLRVFDEEIDLIEDDAIRKPAYLEKGLVLLDAGEKAAVDYLVRLDDRAQLRLKENVLGRFVQERMVKLLEKEASEKTSIEKGGTSAQYLLQERKLLNNIKKAYGLWLKGSPFEKHAKELYAKILYNHFRYEIEKRGTVTGIAWLKRWNADSFVPAKKVSQELRQQIGVSLLRVFKEAKDPVTVGLNYIENRDWLIQFTGGQLNLLWLAIAEALEDEKQMKRILRSQQRQLASKKLPIPEELQEYLWFVSGRVLAKLRRFSQADQLLRKVKRKEFVTPALKVRLEIYQASGKYANAYKIGKKLFIEGEKDRKEAHLQQLYDVVEKGKLWGSALDLLQMSKDLGLKESKVAPYYFLAGRAQYARSRCQSAVNLLERALNFEPSSKLAAEGRYKLGKCLYQVGRAAQGEKIWEELVGMKDSFWSPLAKNELSLRNSN